MIRTLLLACLSILLVVAVITRPGEAFQASLQGLTIWWNIVFPGLLPFLTLLEFMLAFGAVHALGTLLQPIMQKLFRLPGEAGIAMALGWTGGFPCGAEAAAALRKANLLSVREGNRVLALSHMPSPLFMLLVVGTGFLRKPELGLSIAVAVWSAALLSALAYALFARRHRNAPPPATAPSQASLLRRAAAAMREARARDGRSFGKLLGEGVSASVAKLMLIGGFMILCSVLVRLLEPLLPAFIPAYVLPGLVESHIGAYASAAANFAGGLPWKAAAIAAVLSWGGISALLQAGAAIAGTGLSLRSLATARLLQSGFAFGLTLLAWKPLLLMVSGIAPAIAAFRSETDRTGVGATVVRASDLASFWPYMPLAVLACLAAFMLLAIAAAATSKPKYR